MCYNISPEKDGIPIWIQKYAINHTLHTNHHKYKQKKETVGNVSGMMKLNPNNIGVKYS